MFDDKTERGCFCTPLSKYFWLKCKLGNLRLKPLDKSDTFQSINLGRTSVINSKYFDSTDSVSYPQLPLFSNHHPLIKPVKSTSKGSK